MERRDAYRTLHLTQHTNVNRIEPYTWTWTYYSTYCLEPYTILYEPIWPMQSKITLDYPYNSDKAKPNKAHQIIQHRYNTLLARPQSNPYSDYRL